jgi:hypothetical protein
MNQNNYDNPDKDIKIFVDLVIELLNNPEKEYVNNKGIIKIVEAFNTLYKNVRDMKNKDKDENKDVTDIKK